MDDKAAKDAKYQEDAANSYQYQGVYVFGFYRYQYANKFKKYYDPTYRDLKDEVPSLPSPSKSPSNQLSLTLPALSKDKGISSKQTQYKTTKASRTIDSTSTIVKKMDKVEKKSPPKKLKIQIPNL